MLRVLKQTWQKLFPCNPEHDASVLRGQDDELPTTTGENQSVLAELQRLQGEIDSFKSRDAEVAALNEGIAAMDVAGKAASRDIAELREFLTQAADRQEKAETQIRLLREQQEMERQRVQGEIDSFKNRDAELAALNESIAAMDVAGKAASREIAELREFLTQAADRQEKTEIQTRLLREQQETERREYQASLQESMARERRQNRRLGWSMLLACCALLLGALAGTATFRDGREYTGQLVELNRDIKEIRVAMERQVAESKETDAASPSDSTRENAVATVTQRGDARRQHADGKPTDTHYHPLNKYRNHEEMLSFFKANAAEPGVINLAEGLQFRIVEQGEGESPGMRDTVILDYSAFLLDGTQLYSSYDESQPVQSSVSQLAPGLREVVPRMEEGARWEVYVSPDFAYRGDTTRNRKKYGYEPLLYVVELKSIIDAGDPAL